MCVWDGEPGTVVEGGLSPYSVMWSAGRYAMTLNTVSVADVDTDRECLSPSQFYVLSQ